MRSGWYEMAWSPKSMGLEAPSLWRAGRRILIQEDLFTGVRSREAVADVLAVVARNPHHFFLLLTEEPGRLREWLAWATTELEGRANAPGELCFSQELVAALAFSMSGEHHAAPWALPNLGVGVPAEDQEQLDARLVDLFRLPVALRFLLADTGRARMDLSRWLQVPSHCCVACGAETLEGGPGGVPNGKHPHLLGCVACGTRFDARLGWVVLSTSPGPAAASLREVMAGAEALAAQCWRAGTPLYVERLAHVEPGGAGEPERIITRKGGFRVQCRACFSEISIPGEAPAGPRADAELHRRAELAWHRHVVAHHMESWSPTLRARALPSAVLEAPRG